MRFNIVIGNPPYSRGTDIDFVYIGHKISTDYTCMITPAKWQTAPQDQNIVSKVSYGQFRKEIVPYISTICFYQDSGEIFEIYQLDGITYYLINKDKQTNCKVINKCKCQKHFNSIEYRDITKRQTLNNLGNKLNELLQNVNKFKLVDSILNKRYVVAANTKLAKGNRSILGNSGMTYCTSMIYILDTFKGEKCQSNENKIIFSSDSREECESFLSFINSRFTRFFILLNISKLNNIWTNDYLRFVPSPLLKENGTYNWNIEYTDSLLYSYYNIPKQYIEVIESVIKERK